MITVTTTNFYTGKQIVRTVLKINKNSIDLAFPEYRNGKARFFFWPNLNKYVYQFSGESFFHHDLRSEK